MWIFCPSWCSLSILELWFHVINLFKFLVIISLCIFFYSIVSVCICYTSWHYSVVLKYSLLFVSFFNFVFVFQFGKFLLIYLWVSWLSLWLCRFFLWASWWHAGVEIILHYLPVVRHLATPISVCFLKTSPLLTMVVDYLSFLGWDRNADTAQCGAELSSLSGDKVSEVPFGKVLPHTSWILDFFFFFR